jgi:hypothetical protein
MESSGVKEQPLTQELTEQRPFHIVPLRALGYVAGGDSSVSSPPLG